MGQAGLRDLDPELGRGPQGLWQLERLHRRLVIQLLSGEASADDLAHSLVTLSVLQPSQGKMSYLHICCLCLSSTWLGVHSFRDVTWSSSSSCTRSRTWTPSRPLVHGSFATWPPQSSSTRTSGSRRWKNWSRLSRRRPTHTVTPSPPSSRISVSSSISTEPSRYYCFVKESSFHHDLLSIITSEHKRWSH